MARGRKKLEAANSSAGRLLEAMQFAKIAIKDDGEIYQNHVVLYGNALWAYNGMVGIYHPIDLDIAACPNGKKLLNVLEACKEEVSITIDNSIMKVKSGNFSAKIDMVSLDQMVPFAADPPFIACGQQLVNALCNVATIVDEKSDSILNSSVLLRSVYAISTDRQTILRSEHGINGIPDIVIPKAAIQAISTAKFPLVSIGGSANSITFHFENGAWIKTQIYDFAYPDVTGILPDTISEFDEIPKGFFEALEVIKKTSDLSYFDFTGTAKEKNFALSSGSIEYALKSLDIEGRYNIEKVLKLKGLVSKIFELQKDAGAYKVLQFKGEKIDATVGSIYAERDHDHITNGDVPF